MKSLRSPLPKLLVLLLAIYSADPALADGKFFRRLEIADEPGIQAQRAVVAFKDGVETLIVQSDVAGEDTSYGWLLPLPAEPTSIEPCLPNSLNALGGIVRPSVAESPQGFLVFSIFWALVMVVVCLDHIRCKARGSIATSIVKIVLGVVIVLILTSLLLPSLATSRAGGIGGVEVLQTTNAGVYDVAVIKGETAEGVEEWLESNGFASSPSATPVIQDHIARDWCFLAAKVSIELGGTATHHPLKVTFPASQAVYPLKLTGTDGEPIQLDLYVIAEQRAVAAGMRTWVCDSFDRDARPNHAFGIFACEVPPKYRAREMRFIRIGIPPVSELMWPGCVLTRLHGRLDAGDMREDLRLTWASPKPIRATLYSQRSAIGWSAAVALLAFSLSFAYFTARAVRMRWSWQTMLRRRFVVGVAFGLIIGAVTYPTFEIVPVTSADRELIRAYMAVSDHWHALRQLSEVPPDAPFPEAYRSLVMADRPDEWADATGDLSGPGDFKIEAADDGWRLTIVNRSYIPVTIRICSDGTPQFADD